MQCRGIQKQQPQEDTEEQGQPVSPVMDDKIKSLLRRGAMRNIYHDKIVVERSKKGCT